MVTSSASTPPPSPGRIKPTSTSYSPSTPTSSNIVNVNTSSSSAMHGATAYRVLQNLSQVEAQLAQIVEDTTIDPRFGSITREWGFMTPGGLNNNRNPSLKEKFQPWEQKLQQCHAFFWQPEAYLQFEQTHCPPNRCRGAYNIPADSPDIKDLPKAAEQLVGNLPLHQFLLEPPTTEVVLEDADFEDYRDAARIMILLGSLSHLCGNAAADPASTPLPRWIEAPLLRVARRLHVEPTLTNFFATQENWTWNHTTGNSNNSAGNVASNNPNASMLTTTNHHNNNDHANENNNNDDDNLVDAPPGAVLPGHPASAPAIMSALLKECQVADRRYRLRTYRDCFVGSQAVDILIAHGFTTSRSEAVRLTRALNDAVGGGGFIAHVANDHLFKDKDLFYRFVGRWKKYHSDKSGKLGITNTGGSSEFLELQPNASTIVVPDDADDEKQSVGSASPGGGGGKGGSSNKRNVAKRLFFRKTISARDEASMDGSLDNTAATPNAKNNERGVGSTTFSQGNASQQSSTNNNKMLSEEDSYLAKFFIKQTLQSSGHLIQMKSYGGEDESLDYTSMAVAAMRSVPLRNRRYRLKVYPKCFIGSQLIDRLVEHDCACTRIEALRLARELNRLHNIFRHVTNAHELMDDYLFYRFTNSFYEMTFLPSLGSMGESENLSHRGGQSSIGNESGDQEVVRDNRMTPSNSSLGTFDPSMDLDLAFGFPANHNTGEFRFENITMLYPAFGNNHERVNQLIPACMGYALRTLPITVIDILNTMKELLEAKRALGNKKQTAGRSKRKADLKDAKERLADLLYQVAFSISSCKEQFQLMSTNLSSSTFNSKHVSIRQTQPFSNGVVVDGKRRKGVTGTQFPYFHVLDWMLGRFQWFEDGSGGDGLVAKLSGVDDSFPPPQRDFIRSLAKLGPHACLRGFMDIIGRPKQVMIAYNYLIECYAGEGGLLTAHCRKLFSYMHNDMQLSTSGTTHAGMNEKSGKSVSIAESNHSFASMMFQHMQTAANDRWRLRSAPLMTKVMKDVYSTSESGGFTTVALDFGHNHGLRYQYGDIVRVLLPNDEKGTMAWVNSLSSEGVDSFTLADMPPTTANGWGWEELWEALGWPMGGGTVPLETVAQYIEEAQIIDSSGKRKWINSPLELCANDKNRFFAAPPKIEIERISVLTPVSPRIYSVSGVEPDRVFLLVSKPSGDGSTKHHGYERMADPRVKHVHCSFAPSTFFLVPPQASNLVCIASGTGISPFVGLADNIGARRGSITIAHQCKSSDLFLSNCQTWLDFTALNPDAIVFGYISGDRSRRNCPMRYVIANGMFEETVLLGRHSKSAYYFQCGHFQNRLKQVYVPGGVNLAYCCGGVKSALDPLKDMSAQFNWDYEYTVETYAVSSSILSEESFSGLILGTVIGLDGAACVHEGGDQIMHHVHKVALERQNRKDGPESQVPAPCLSKAFCDLHPHAYNLHRCLRAPLDADFEAFASFLERQGGSHRAIAGAASKYAQCALAFPSKSKIVRIACELQSEALVRQLHAGDRLGARESAGKLQALLDHVSDDERASKWKNSLAYYTERYRSE